MVKMKVVKTGGMSVLKIKLGKKQELNKRESELLVKRNKEGLLPLMVEERWHATSLCYNITGFITLKEYLHMPIAKENFLRLIENLTTILESMEKDFLNFKNLIISFTSIYVNPSTSRISFVYLPIQYYDHEVPLTKFFLDIAYECIFEDTECAMCVREYTNMLKSNISFSLYEIRTFAAQMKHEQAQAESLAPAMPIKCPVCGTKNHQSAKFCVQCGASLHKDQEQILYHPEPRLPKPSEDTETEEETTILRREEADEDATTVLLAKHQAPWPMLVDEQTKEIIRVQKRSFTIGKKKDNDLVIANGSISRHHAIIVYRKDHWMIKDLGSTNKTCVDDMELPPQQEHPLHDGQRITFSDVSYLFQMKEGTV